ncbi:MAG: NUDIX domain-containing protein, partial [Nanoarchaeota archaeon]|nr:NUDIX domain-containing protein [Nanoarchaeota archaeon]
MVREKYRKAVFIVAYKKQGEGFEYLLLKRKLHWNGWEFPKGAIEFLETKRRAVLRELFEETGLKPVGKIKKFNYSGKYNYGKVLKDRLNFKGQTFTLYA